MFKFIEKFKGKIEEKRLVKVSDCENSLIVSVPDIKAYLVAEFERNNNLQLVVDGMKQKIEEAEEIKLKYEASLVTLDAYKRRVDSLESRLASEQRTTANARQDTANAVDELNSYKIKLNNAALTKEEIADEIAEETKQKIIAKINNHKGNLSKKIVIEIIEGDDK